MEKTISSILPVVLVFAFSGFLFSIVIVAHRNFLQKKVAKLSVILLLVYHLYIILKITLLGRVQIPVPKVWLIPMYSYYRYLSNWEVFLFKQNIQNILLFCPFGFLASILFDGKSEVLKRKFILIVTFLFSVSIETIQYTQAIGVFEIDDIIHNMLGALLGCLSYETICCIRIQGTLDGIKEIQIINQKKFQRNRRMFEIVLITCIAMFFIAYGNHLYHVYVLWR